MEIKVCGLKDKANIAQVAELSPDYMGFIFYAETPRFARDLALSTLKKIPSGIIKTAVFVNEDVKNIRALVKKYKFDAIQLHGNEGPEVCALFKGGVKVIKAFGLNKNFDFDTLYPYADHVDFFLFDAKTDLYGGSGQSFDWDMLDDYELDIPFFLSGGIGLDNLGEVNDVRHPQFYGVDLNSRFETSPGIKDIGKLQEAFVMIKQFDNP